MSIQNSHQIGNVKVMLVKGENGSSIVSITKTGTVGDVDTYTVATSDGGRYTFEVTNGSDIQSIEKTSSHGMVDTYTVTLTNGNTTTFEVTNGDNWIDNSEKTATDAFQTITGGLLKECKVALSPVQSGSGDPSPTNVRPITGHTQVKVLRTGKNIVPLTVDAIKAINTNGTWVGNSYIRYGITFELQTDNNGNVVGIKATGTATANSFLMLAYNLPHDYDAILNGCPANGGDGLFELSAYRSDYVIYRDIGNGVSIPSSFRIDELYIKISNGCAISSSGVTFYPMIRRATDSNTSFQPYEGETYTVEIPAETGTVYGGILDLVSGELDAEYVKMDISTGISFSGRSSTGGLEWHDFIVNAVDGFGMSNKLPYIANGDSAWSSSTPCFTINSNGNVRIYANPSTFPTDYADTVIVYKNATPTVIQLTPTQVETLIGDNNLLCPLAGQAMVEDGVKYFYIYTYRDLMQGMQDIADALEEDVTEITNNAVEEVSEMAGVWTTPALASVGDTSITISDASITTSSIIEVYCQNASGNPISITNMAVTTGQAVLSFYALAEATSFRLHVLN